MLAPERASFCVVSQCGRGERLRVWSHVQAGVAVRRCYGERMCMCVSMRQRQTRLQAVLFVWWW